MDEEVFETLEAVANILRGMGFDARIPEDTRQCLAGLVADLDAITATAEDDD